MDITTLINAAFGAFSLIGGIIGYVKAKSAASLIAGSGSGILLLLCAYKISQGSHTALLSSLGIALALGGRFLCTWLKNRRVMPDLLMALFSAATLVADGLLLLRR